MMSLRLVMPPRDALIGGVWVDTRDTLEVEAPARGEVLTRIARCRTEEVNEAVVAAGRAFSGRLGDWSAWTARRRSEWLLAFATAIEADREGLAALECADTGKPMTRSEERRVGKERKSR